MTKVLKKFFVVLAVLALTITLAGCGFESKAQKLDDEFKAQQEAGKITMTFEEIEDKMGKATIDEGSFELGGIVTGVFIWIDGCDDYEDLEELWEKEESAAGLIVSVVGGKVTSVDYVEKYGEDAE